MIEIILGVLVVIGFVKVMWDIRGIKQGSGLTDKAVSILIKSEALRELDKITSMMSGTGSSTQEQRKATLETLYNQLKSRKKEGKLDKNEEILFSKLEKEYLSTPSKEKVTKKVVKRVKKLILMRSHCKYIKKQMNKEELKIKKQRSLRQNRCMWKYFNEVARECQSAGISAQVFIRAFSVDVTKEMIENAWRGIIDLKYGYDSTRTMSQKEVTDTYDEMNRGLASMGLHVEWPSWDNVINRDN